MRLNLRKIAVGVLATAGAAGLAWLLLVSPHVRFHTLRIVGNTRATTAAVTHLAALPAGEPLVLVDLEAAVAAVERHPWVARAEASRRLPDTIVIRVEERVAAGLVQLDQLYVVDAEGQPFVKAGPADLDRVVLTGLRPELAHREPELARRVIRDGLAVANAVAGRAGLSETDVSEVHFDASAGYTLILRNGGEVLLGFQDADRLDRLDLLAKNGLDLSKPQRIDLAAERLAVVTPL